jgi:gluconolactonase
MTLDLTPSFEVVDRRFRRVALPYIQVEKLYSGCRWAEGPPGSRRGDISSGRTSRTIECCAGTKRTARCRRFRQPSHNSNGNTVDTLGRLVTCEHRSRCVTRTDFDGTRTVLADRFDGKRFNSPNDVVVKSDGSIWFTDPSYGIDSDYEGDAAKARSAPATSTASIPPAGKLQSSPRTSCSRTGSRSRRTNHCFTSSTRADAQGGRPAPRAPLQGFRQRQSVGGGEVFATCPVGLYDGFRVDVHGNLWLSAGDGVHCHSSDGTLLGKIRISEAAANVCFGGPKLNRLFICGTTSLYSVYLNTRAAPRG